MRVAVTCECGHVTELDSRERIEAALSGDTVSGARRFCSACGRSLADAVSQTVEEASPPAAQGTFQQLWQSRLKEDVAEAQEVAPTSTEPVGEQPASTTDGRRSLWEVMRGARDE